MDRQHISIGMLPNLKNHQERCLEIKSNPNNLKLAYIKLKLLRAATVRRLPEPLRANKKLFSFFSFFGACLSRAVMREVLLAAKVRSRSAFYTYQFFWTYNFIEETYLHVPIHGGSTSKPNYVANNP